MAISVRLDDDFVAEAQVHANASKRSVPKQIEYWATIGRMAEDNPDLPYEFIKDALLVKEQVLTSQVRRYDRRKKSGN